MNATIKKMLDMTSLDLIQSLRDEGYTLVGIANDIGTTQSHLSQLTTDRQQGATEELWRPLAIMFAKRSSKAREMFSRPGSVLVNALRESGMSLADITKRIGGSRSTISRIGNNRNAASETTYKKLVRLASSQELF